MCLMSAVAFIWGHAGGVYDSKVCKNGKKDVNHAVLAVGYATDSASGADYWIIKNSK